MRGILCTHCVIDIKTEHIGTCMRHIRIITETFIYVIDVGTSGRRKYYNIMLSVFEESSSFELFLLYKIAFVNANTIRKSKITISHAQSSRLRPW